MRTNYSVKIERGWIKFYIKDFLHLAIKGDKLLGVQSWEMDGMYCIEYTFEGGSILSEYNKADKWKTMLNLVNMHL